MSGRAGAVVLRVLVIEDEALVAMLLEDMILDAGHQVVGVLGDADAALDYVNEKSNTFDAAVLDVNLAGRPSFPIADVLAKKAKPFIFSTGYGREGLPAEWKDRPVLAKPFGANTVTTALNQLAAG